MRLGFRGKLLAVILSLLAIITAGALLTVRHRFGSQLREQAAKELTAGSRVLSSILSRSGSQLQDRGRLLAELPSLQQALSKDHSQLEPLLLEVKAIRAANLLWTTDRQGIVLASTGEYPPLGENLSQQPLIAASLAGQETLGFDLFGGEWWLLLCIPVARSDPQGKELLGTVTLGLLVGEPYLARLSELMGCRIAFLWGENRLWSEGWPEGMRAQAAHQAVKSLTKAPEELSLLGQGRFLWMARPVTGGVPPIATGPIALLGIRLDETVIQRTTRTIGWIAIVTMVLGAFLSVWTIRPLLLQLETTQNRLAQAEKLASVGQLAAGVAHELNNPLMVIMGNAQLALRILAKAKAPFEEILAEIKELMRSLDQEAHRSKKIVGNLLDFTRLKPPAQMETDLNALMEDSLRLVGHQENFEKVEVIRRYAQDLPSVQCDPNQIKQVFVNVILNALQAMPEGGKLIMETERSENRLVAKIQDTGIGIPPEAVSKVFDPFFTTKEMGKGTGLGLYISYGILQSHRGSISLTSELGKGTTVTIHLPL